MSEAVQKLLGGGRVMAPMVRAGTLPLRLQALGMGADAVYAEELIDHKMLTTKREVDERSGLVSYVLKKDPSKVVFRTCALERERVWFQVGTSDPDRAVKVAQLVAKDVAAFDINMGCPKPFSVKGGMGAALLKTPEVAEDILKALRRNVTEVPITCKIRLLADEKSSVELVRRLESAGAQAIGVHMRETHMRPRESAHWDRLQPLVDAVDVPIIANGDIYTRENAAEVLKKSKARAAMFARGALRNPSVFLDDGFAELPLYDVMRDYTRISMLVDNHTVNTVYTLQQMARYNPAAVTKTAPYCQVLTKPRCRFDDLAAVFNLSAEECKLTGPITWEALRLTRATKRTSVAPAGSSASAGTAADADNAAEPPAKRVAAGGDSAQPGRD